MSRARLGLLALLVAATGGAIWLFGRGTDAGPSSLSRGPDGWLAARLYLESQGGTSELLDRPFSGAVKSPVLVMAFPWQVIDVNSQGAVRRFVQQGGTLLLAYSGRARSFGEDDLFERLGLEATALRGPAPLSPGAWRDYQRETWSLEPEAGDPGHGRALVIEALARAPKPAAEATALYRHGPQGPVLIFRSSYGKGEVIALPAGALANHQLDEGGNRDLLFFLAAELGTSWAFDEYHHGLVGVDPAAEKVSLLPFDLFFVHLAALYLAAVWALARRFGPAWRESVPRLGSAVTFLSGLGRLHDRAGHHPDAALLLLTRLRELEPALAADLDTLPDLDERAVKADRRALIKIAREVAALRARRAGTPLEER